MAGDSGDIYQAKKIMEMRNNPDWRYEGMSRSEIEADVKNTALHCSHKSIMFWTTKGKSLNSL